MSDVWRSNLIRDQLDILKVCAAGTQALSGMYAFFRLHAVTTEQVARDARRVAVLGIKTEQQVSVTVMSRSAHLLVLLFLRASMCNGTATLHSGGLHIQLLAMTAGFILAWFCYQMSSVCVLAP